MCSAAVAWRVPVYNKADYSASDVPAHSHACAVLQRPSGRHHAFNDKSCITEEQHMVHYAVSGTRSPVLSEEEGRKTAKGLALTTHVTQ